MSETNEDIFQMSYLISKCGYVSGQEYLTKKFSQDAIAKDCNKNAEQSAIVRILDGLSNFTKDKHQIAVLKFIEVQLPSESSDTFEKTTLSEILTINDLAYYICLAALNSCDRKELKETVLKSNNFVMLTSSVNESSVIVEQFLNGNYKDF